MHHAKGAFVCEDKCKLQTHTVPPRFVSSRKVPTPFPQIKKKKILHFFDKKALQLNFNLELFTTTKSSSHHHDETTSYLGLFYTS